jgi:hypothetical protein
MQGVTTKLAVEVRVRLQQRDVDAGPSQQQRQDGASGPPAYDAAGGPRYVAHLAGGLRVCSLCRDQSTSLLDFGECVGGQKGSPANNLGEFGERRRMSS